MQKGCRNFTYEIALSRGKSVEKNEMRTSQRGQLSTSIGRTCTRQHTPDSLQRASLTFVEYDLVSEDFDLYGASGSVYDAR